VKRANKAAGGKKKKTPKKQRREKAPGVDKERRKGREQVPLSVEKGFPIWEALFISQMKGCQP
jgi:hypothetical protein